MAQASWFPNILLELPSTILVNGVWIIEAVCFLNSPVHKPFLIPSQKLRATFQERVSEIQVTGTPWMAQWWTPRREPAGRDQHTSSVAAERHSKSSFSFDRHKRKPIWGTINEGFLQVILVQVLPFIQITKVLISMVSKCRTYHMASVSKELIVLLRLHLCTLNNYSGNF